MVHRSPRALAWTLLLAGLAPGVFGQSGAGESWIAGARPPARGFASFAERSLALLGPDGFEAGDEVRTVAITGDGSLLAACPHKGNLQVWRTQDRVLLASIPVAGPAADDLAFSPDGRILARTGRGAPVLYRLDRLPEAVDLASGVPASRNLVKRLQFSPDGEALFWCVGAEVWRTELGSQKSRLVWRSPGDVRSLALSGGGRSLGVVTVQEGFHLLRLDSLGRPVGPTRFLRKQKPVRDAWIDSGGYGALLVAGDHWLVWRPMNSDRPLWSIDLRQLAGMDYASGLSVSSDGQHACVHSGFSGRFALFRVGATGATLVRTVSGPSSASWSGVLSSDGGSLAFVSGGGVVHLRDRSRWSGERGGLGDSGQDSAISGLCFSPDSRWLASTDEDGTVRVWDPRGARLAGALAVAPGAGRVVACWSPDGQTLAVGDAQGRCSLWRWPDAAQPFASVEIEGPIRKLAYSPDGSRLAVGARELTFLRSSDLAQVGVLVPRSPAVSDLVFTRDASRVLYSGPGQVLGQVDVGSARLLSPENYGPRMDLAYTLGCAPGTGEYVMLMGIQASLAAPATPLVWRRLLEADERIPEGAYHSDSALSTLAFSPDGTRVVLAWNWGRQRARNRLLVHGFPTGELLEEVAHPLGAISAVVVSPDGSMVAAAGSGSTRVAVWSTR